MYDELAKKLRRCGKGLCTEDCPDWTKENLYHTCQDELVLEASDAIEEMQKQVLEWQKSRDLERSLCAVMEKQVPRWIPVTERLPGNERVLIYSKDGGVSEGKYNHRDEKWTQYRWSVKNEYVTHWMPLPEPPKEK